MPHVKTILFDFDGTIADTLSVCIEIANKNSEKYGYRKIEQDEIEHLRSLTPMEILQEFKVPFYKLPFLLKKMQLEFFESIDRIQVFPGIKFTIETLHKQGYLLGIITSNSEKSVRHCMEKHNITSFDFIHNEKNILGKSHTIKHVIKDHHLNKDEVLYVGDEVRDIYASKKSGIGCIAVTWGFNTKELLSRHSPAFLVDKPQEILSVLK